MMPTTPRMPRLLHGPLLDPAAKRFVALREDDPRRADLEAQGCPIVGQSWGARLEIAEPPDVTVFRTALSRVHAAGIRISELSVDSALELQALEQANNADYPFAPATSRQALDADSARALWTDGARVFGAFDGAQLVGAFDGAQLVGASVINHGEDRAETEFTSVLRSHRGRGIGAAVKAASILACVDAGARLFGTGGAAANDASLGVNRALGYQLTERWYSYQLPPGADSDRLGAAESPSSSRQAR